MDTYEGLDGLRDWHASGRTFDHCGHTIFYREDGEGEALVCIHGFPTASWDWHRLWPALTRRFRVIAPDMIGFGFSDKPAGYDYSLMDQATLVEALLDDLGVASVHVLAHDYGDTVAQELLARRAEGVPGPALRSVCLLNGGLFPEAVRPRPIQRLLRNPVLSPMLGRLLTERRFRKSFRAVFGPGTQPSDEDLRAFWALVSHNGGTRVAHRIIRYMNERERHRARWTDALRHTRTPLRLINGPEDPVSGAAMAARFRTLVPGADVVLLDGIGHYPQVEAPERVRDAFLAFVERAGATPSVT
ncbi:alpha/beta fold hydrolase [Rhodocaloribacter sp.]